MTLSPSAPAETATNDIPLAIQNKEAKRYTITSSLVEKKEFSPEELALINTRLQSLQDKVNSGLKKNEARLTLTPEKLTELRTQLANG